MIHEEAKKFCLLITENLCDFDLIYAVTGDDEVHYIFSCWIERVDIDDSDCGICFLTNDGQGNYFTSAFGGPDDPYIAVMIDKCTDYDGGFETGFMGSWDSEKHSRLVDYLESERKDGSKAIVELAGREFLLYPHGGGENAYYRYIIEGGGLKLYIHHKAGTGNVYWKFCYSSFSWWTKYGNCLSKWFI